MGRAAAPPPREMRLLLVVGKGSKRVLLRVTFLKTVSHSTVGSLTYLLLAPLSPLSSGVHHAVLCDVTAAVTAGHWTSPHLIRLWIQSQTAAGGRRGRRRRRGGEDDGWSPGVTDVQRTGGQTQVDSSQN